MSAQMQAKIAEALARKVAVRSVEDIEREILEQAAQRAQALEDGGATLARFVQRLDDPDLARIRRAFADDAAREVGERYGLLVSTAIEAMLSERTAAEIAVVLRALRDIEPTDVRALAGFVRASEEGKRFAFQQRYEPRERTAQGQAGRDYLEASPSRAALLGAQLVVIETNWTIDQLPAFTTQRGELAGLLTRAWVDASPQ